MIDYNNGGMYARPMEIELIRSMSHRPLNKKENKILDNYLQGPPSGKDAFIIKPAGDWLQLQKNKPGLNKLFGDFWYEGELCIMFADTNVGKSILAVQIGDSLSRGEPIPGFGEAPQPQTVLYFDFELTAAQFEKRYNSTRDGNHRFSADFYRLVFNPDATGAKKFDTYAAYLNNAIENVLTVTGARTLIVDNITCLRSGTEASANAIDLMNNLKTIRQKYGLSILVLAHTPKRNPAKPITRNDLQGSKMLINFADSAFAIGESQSTPGLRYLKQIKQRSGNEFYGAANILLCRMVKPASFLHFEFTGHSNESLHLLHHTQQQRKQTEDRIITLYEQGLSLRAVAAESGLPVSTVYRFLKKLDRGVSIQ